jgi:hypothetical protein
MTEEACGRGEPLASQWPEIKRVGGGPYTLPGQPSDLHPPVRLHSLKFPPHPIYCVLKKLEESRHGGACL